MLQTWGRESTSVTTEETAFELIALAYDAALAPEKWPVLMERLVKAVGTRSAILRENYAAGSVGLFEAMGYDPAFVAAYREHYVNLDYYAPILRRTPIGSPLRGSEAVPWERQRKTEFFNDYFVAQGIHHAFGCILARNDSYDLLFGMQREVGQPDFSEDDFRLIRLVAPHMARAVQINRRMAEVTAQKHWAWSALERLRVGVILLGDRGRPLFLNRAAERLASGRNGFVAGREGLTLPAVADTTRLRRLIADAASLATGHGMAAGGCLRVRAVASTAAALQFQVIPLPQGLSERPWAQSSCNGCVAVFVSTAGGPRLSAERVAAMHRLTRAEARLAATLAQGISLEEAAAALSISIHTVRSQLKSVFAKTGVTRQAELVALLLADMLIDQADAQA